MQLDNSQNSNLALKELVGTSEYDFDLSQSSARLKIIVFNSQTCTDVTVLILLLHL